MSRYATWVRRPEDPVTPLPWVMSSDRHIPEARRRVVRRVLFASLALSCVVGFLIHPLAAFVTLAVALVGLMAYARPGAREHSALATLGGGLAYPVALELEREGRRIGRENGWVAFADGWLVYEGLRTSFSFRNVDAMLLRVKFCNAAFRLSDGGTLRLSLLASVLPMESPGVWCARKEFAQDFAKWSHGPTPSGDPILPPMRKSPACQGERILNTLGLSLALVVLSLGLAFLDDPVRACLAALLMAGCVAKAAYDVQELRDSLRASSREIVAQEG